MTLSETPLPLVQTWLEYLHRHGRSPHTLKAYQRAWQHLSEWYEGSYGEPCDPARQPQEFVPQYLPGPGLVQSIIPGHVTPG